ncbi:CRISPR-associated endoribonuclease Cas6 [Numidum massiliense]|uniref:CRISPR-associated endoribonuclease Cas6 n=1 Tax=Numidum massiliense TaxID=1522315 RepID=UPI0006D57C37|nr:CRISPR-associated endoribonuclease Cas6 [Numidum massiliense]
MRLHVVLEANKLTIPVQYEQIMQGVIYRSLSNPKLTSFLHDSGFQYNKRSFKMFTFSKLLGAGAYDRETRKLTFDGELKWQVSSALPAFIHDLGQALLLEPSLQLHQQDILVKEVTYRNPTITSATCKIKMLSPITVASTYVGQDGKKLTHFFAPDDLAFSHMVKENLLRKYTAFTGETRTDDFVIRPLSVSRQHKVVTKFKGTIINAWGGIYEVQSTPRMLTFAHQVGLGSRNSAGFGLFELLA